MKPPKNRRKRIVKARRTFPKVIASHAEQTAKVMVAKKMTTAHNVFEGAVGPAMVLVTLDPTVVSAIVAVLEAMGGEIKPAAEVEAPTEKPELIALEGGVATLALQGAVVPDGQTAMDAEYVDRLAHRNPVHDADDAG
jgi:hypothetical protein